MRPETVADIAAVRAVHVAAFPSPARSPPRAAAGAASASPRSQCCRATSGAGWAPHSFARALPEASRSATTSSSCSAYRRFGFETASRFDLANQYGADEAFMALPLHPAGRSAVAGLIRYQPEFR